MKLEEANRLLTRPFIEQRWIVAISPHGKKVTGWLVSLDGNQAIVKRKDGKRDFKADLQLVQYR